MVLVVHEHVRGEGRMSVEPGDDAALLQTIVELRNDVNRLIDEQLAWVRALEEKRASEPASERRYSAPQVPAPPAPRAPRATAVARVREPAEQRPAPETDDPSQRLDALARHLDGRLRRSNGKHRATPGELPDRFARDANGNGSGNGATNEAKQ
jgi:hypothetical protein